LRETYALDGTYALHERPTNFMGTATSPIQRTATTTSTQMLSANPARTGLAIINLSDNNVSISFGHPAVLNAGITLVPKAAFAMDAFLFTNQAVNAISVSPVTLSIQEFE
jgi:hypothetical protein